LVNIAKKNYIDQREKYFLDDLILTPFIDDLWQADLMDVQYYFKNIMGLDIF